MVISDGVFSKSKSLVSNNKVKPKYDNSLAIRGIISKDNIPKINIRNISLFLGSNFHYVVYPLNSNDDLNFIGIIKHKGSLVRASQYNAASGSEPRTDLCKAEIKL